MAAWVDLVRKHDKSPEFRSGAESRSLLKAESQLGTKLPTALREALLESNGIFGDYGLGLVWPIERIVDDNLAFRSNAEWRDLYMPFDPLLFFGDAGNGDQFAFVVLNGVIRRNDVFVWNHEEDSRTMVAPDLESYLEWLADGRIKL